MTAPGKYGMLTVIGEAETRQSPSGQRKKYMTVQCDCGTVKEVRRSHLVNGKTYSCGCTKLGKRTHGMSHTKLYDTWCGMKQRCYDENCKSYRWWGAKGVTVCDTWRYSFSNFYVWAIHNGYEEGLTIDRVDNASVYSPDTCEWVTLQENIRRRDEIRRSRH